MFRDTRTSSSRDSAGLNTPAIAPSISSSSRQPFWKMYVWSKTVVQPESVGIEGALFDRHDGGASEEWSCRWVCDMAAGDLMVSQGTATGSSVARMAYRSVWPKGHPLRC